MILAALLAATLNLAEVRARLTPRNAATLLPSIVAGEPAAADFLIDVAHRALAMHEPDIAGLAAEQALARQSTRRAEIARVLVEVARAFTPGQPALAQYALSEATSADPTLSAAEDVLWLKQVTAPCGRGALLRAYLRHFSRGPHARQATQALQSRKFKPCVPMPFIGGGCGNVRSPFAYHHSSSDERFFH